MAIIKNVFFFHLVHNMHQVHIMCLIYIYGLNRAIGIINFAKHFQNFIDDTNNDFFKSGK